MVEHLALARREGLVPLTPPRTLAALPPLLAVAAEGGVHAVEEPLLAEGLLSAGRGALISQRMANSTRYYVFGPDSGGVYFLDVEGDELTHGGSGENAPTLGADEARELVSTYLLRFAGAAPGFEVLDALRADLDGEFRVGAWRVRFASGRALEARIPWGCADCGVGGHACTEFCAGPLPVEEIVRDVQAMCGRPIAVARHGTAHSPNSPWIADGYVIFDDTPKLTAPA